MKSHHVIPEVETMTVVLLQSPDRQAPAAPVRDAFGVRIAVQMLRAGEVTVQQFLAMCEEAAEQADAERDGR